MSLADVLKSVQTGALKNILTGAGVSLATSSISYLAFQQAVNAVKTKAYGVGGDIIALLHIAGMDIFLSTILAATATYLTLNATKLSLTKAIK